MNLSLIRLSLPSFLSRFARNRKGAAIVEFALVTPIMLAVLAGINDFSSLILKEKAMRASVSSAAQYIMSGGADLDVAKKIVNTSWTPESEEATVAAVKQCYCAGSLSGCSTVCADKTIPQAYVTISAVEPYDGWYMASSITVKQKVRTR